MSKKNPTPQELADVFMEVRANIIQLSGIRRGVKAQTPDGCLVQAIALMLEYQTYYTKDIDQTLSQLKSQIDELVRSNKTIRENLKDLQHVLDKLPKVHGSTKAKSPIRRR